MDVGDLTERVLEVHRRLCDLYGCPIHSFHNLDPLSELISSLLSHRTKNRDSARAFRNLQKRFPNWGALIHASVDEIEREIMMVTWPDQKAPRLQEVLREISVRRKGDLSLDFLGGLSEDEARDWLEELPGVGPKTSAAVLIFSTLRKAALPVDSHHHRVAQRLGFIDRRVSVGLSHKILRDQLPTDWDVQKIYDNHEVMMFHGQKVCFYANPACRKCVLLDLCPTGQERLMHQPYEYGVNVPREAR